MDKRVERVQELMKDENFVKELFTKENPEDVQAYFEDHGVGLSIDEVKQLGTMFGKLANGELNAEQLEKGANGELSEDELEKVAGGEILCLIAIGVVSAVAAGGTATGSYFATKAIANNWDSITDFFSRW